MQEMADNNETSRTNSAGRNQLTTPCPHHAHMQTAPNACCFPPTHTSFQFFGRKATELTAQLHVQYNARPGGCA